MTSNTHTIITLTQQHIDQLVADHILVLGQGGSCTVYLVKVGGDLCCLKVASSQRFSGIFHREFDILLELDGVAGAPKALGISFGFPALLTTFCGHHTFRDLHLIVPRDNDRLQAFLSLARNVKQLHAHGFAHGDIKENNIVLRQDSDGRLKVSLIDYGLSMKFREKICIKDFDQQHFPWMAPELFGRGSRCSPAMDVFSLGCVLRNMLDKCCTQYPTLEVLAAKAMSSNPSKRPSVGHIIKVIMQQLTNEVPKKKTFVHRVRRVLRVFCCCFPLHRNLSGNSHVKTSCHSG